jgi:hypothetical protein
VKAFVAKNAPDDLAELAGWSVRFRPEFYAALAVAVEESSPEAVQTKLQGVYDRFGQFYYEVALLREAMNEADTTEFDDLVAQAWVRRMMSSTQDRPGNVTLDVKQDIKADMQTLPKAHGKYKDHPELKAFIWQLMKMGFGRMENFEESPDELEYFRGESPAE